MTTTKLKQNTAHKATQTIKDTLHTYLLTYSVALVRNRTIPAERHSHTMNTIQIQLINITIDNY
jgi:hypothetical protein